MTPTTQQLDGLLDLIVEAVLREMEDPPKGEAAGLSERDVAAALRLAEKVVSDWAAESECGQ